MAKESSWQNRIVGHGVKPASQFVAHPGNWRTHPQAQRDALQGALNEVGWVSPVVVNVRTGHLLDGHERVSQALESNDAQVPYIEVDLDEAEEAYVLATLDPIGAMAGKDDAKLNELLHQINSGEAGIQAMLSALGPKEASVAYRPLEEIDTETIADYPRWVLIRVEPRALPAVIMALQPLDAVSGVTVEISDEHGQ